jgi:uroporphyrinogen decarboxylase
MMTPKERLLAVLQRKKPDRLPTFFNATPEAAAKMYSHCRVAGYDEFCDLLHIDKHVHVEPRYIGPALPERTTFWGAQYKDIHYDGGTYSGLDGVIDYHPLAKCHSVEEIMAAYRWPSADWWDYSVLKEQITGKEEWVIVGGGSEPFMDYKEQLRGVEQAFMDLHEHPDMVAYCLQKMYDLAYEKTTRMYEAIPGRILVSWVAEDMGTQESMLYSPKHIRQFFLPHMKRMIDLVHQAGAYAFHHSDGAVREIIPDMIGLGIDVLNPIQWRCPGMDREGLVRDFGDQVIFHGAMDNQYTLAFGSVKEVRQEVLDNVRILGSKGGYVPGPCHNIQVISPPENIVTMYRTIAELNI